MTGGIAILVCCTRKAIGNLKVNKINSSERFGESELTSLDAYVKETVLEILITKNNRLGKGRSRERPNLNPFVKNFQA